MSSACVAVWLRTSIPFVILTATSLPAFASYGQMYLSFYPEFLVLCLFAYLLLIVRLLAFKVFNSLRMVLLNVVLSTFLLWMPICKELHKLYRPPYDLDVMMQIILIMAPFVWFSLGAPFTQYRKIRTKALN